MATDTHTGNPAAPTGAASGAAAHPTGYYDVVVTRGDMVESRHRVHVAVVNANGELLLKARDPMLRTWWRSCAKPFQLMPFMESGGVDALDWGQREIALACASHGGESEHVELAASMLSSVGAGESDLACGAHEPLTRRGVEALKKAGEKPTRLHNNCSGKHAAMIAHAKSIGAPVAGYHIAGHPIQQRIAATVAKWTGLPESSIKQGVDGCGVPVFGLPLFNMALSYARLATPGYRDSTNNSDSPQRIINAMMTHPFLVGGTGRFDSILMDACQGTVLCKIGAEGVHTAALTEQGIGIALKAECGSARAQYPALLAVLQTLGAFPNGIPEALTSFAASTILNTRGETVGRVYVEQSGIS